tara:strand:- start:2128 stop:2895 length:768 start_codon:yes stop_codon:yes gene_type:complete
VEDRRKLSVDITQERLLEEPMSPGGVPLEEILPGYPVVEFDDGGYVRGLTDRVRRLYRRRITRTRVVDTPCVQCGYEYLLFQRRNENSVARVSENNRDVYRCPNCGRSQIAESRRNFVPELPEAAVAMIRELREKKVRETDILDKLHLLFGIRMCKPVYHKRLKKLGIPLTTSAGYKHPDMRHPHRGKLTDLVKEMSAEGRKYKAIKQEAKRRLGVKFSKTTFYRIRQELWESASSSLVSLAVFFLLNVTFAMVY